MFFGNQFFSDYSVPSARGSVAMSPLALICLNLNLINLAPLAPSVHILSGDNQEAVSHMAALAGIEAAQVNDSDKGG